MSKVDKILDDIQKYVDVKVSNNSFILSPDEYNRVTKMWNKIKSQLDELRQPGEKEFIEAENANYNKAKQCLEEYHSNRLKAAQKHGYNNVSYKYRVQEYIDTTSVWTPHKEHINHDINDEHLSLIDRLKKIETVLESKLRKLK